MPHNSVTKLRYYSNFRWNVVILCCYCYFNFISCCYEPLYSEKVINFRRVKWFFKKRKMEKKRQWKELLQREKNKKLLLDFKLLEENYFPCGKKSEWDKKKCFALLTKKSKKKKKKKKFSQKSIINVIVWTLVVKDLWWKSWKMLDITRRKNGMENSFLWTEEELS